MADLPIIISAMDLAQQLSNKDLILVDLSRQSTYQMTHIPGARQLLPRSTLSSNRSTPGSLPSINCLQNILSQLGIEKNSHIIAYDDEGGGWAGRLIWILDSIGHTAYSYLNGGLHAWRKEGLPLSQETADWPVSHYIINKIHKNFSINKGELLSLIHQKNVKIWDTRSADEFSGKQQFAKRPGHIPTAFNLDWRAIMSKDGKFTISDTLADQLLHFGVTLDTTLITYCQTNHRAAFAYLAAKSIGIKDVRTYPESWDEWGNSFEVPVNTIS